MDDRVLHMLEYDKVLALLAEGAASALGREAALALLPTTRAGDAQARQRETSEARQVLASGQSVPLTGIHDLRDALHRARIGAMLDAEELLRVAVTLRVARRLQTFLDRLESCPQLSALGQSLDPLPAVADPISAAITDAAEVADDASPELHRLRRQITALQGRIRDVLDDMVRAPSLREYLQEPLVTLREDRYVLPIKLEHKNRVPGVVHDRSASGATLFIEPMAVVNLNNDLRQRALEERAEVERILRQLTATVAAHAGPLGATLDALRAIDFACAKGALSLRLDAAEPALDAIGAPDAWIDLHDARHPLLRGNVVPIDVELGRNFRSLVLTGPNTGGKTVTLKTLGLLTLMAQAGLHVPAAPGSRLVVFDRVVCDIGDEQSIEQSLSTFSSHMRNIVGIVAEVDDRSLVLLDEIGAGTDPLEGAALAMSLLEFLYARGSWCASTTHYSELKTFAFSREGFENASVEFDVQTLQPTFKVVVGLPGRSNAFEIAARLGLPAAITARARQYLSGEELRVEGLIGDLMAQRDRMEKANRELDEARRRAARLTQELEDKREQFRLRYERAVERARDDARDIVRRARQDVADTLRELHDQMKAVDDEAADRKRIQAAETTRERLKEIEAEIAPSSELEPLGPPEAPDGAVPGTLSEGDLKPGRPVWLCSLRQRAYVVDAPSPGSDQVRVQVGAIKLFVPRHDLAPAPDEAAGGAGDPAQTAERTNVAEFLSAKARTLSPEIHLRGLKVEEALARLDKYLDDACLAGLPTVRIVHGKGTGVLREAVAALLATDSRVGSYRLGERGEGGEGVTVATLGGGTGG